MEVAGDFGAADRRLRLLLCRCRRRLWLFALLFPVCRGWLGRLLVYCLVRFFFGHFLRSLTRAKLTRDPLFGAMERVPFADVLGMAESEVEDEWV